MAHWWLRILDTTKLYRHSESDYDDDESSDDDSSDDHEEDDKLARVRRNPEYYESLWQHYIQPRSVVLRPQPRGIHRVSARPNLFRRWIVCLFL